jgi:GNAT superfamily N-acetyltransferase
MPDALFADTPHVRRATKRDAAQVAPLWRALLDEQAAADARLAVADDALDRWHNDFPLWLDDGTRLVLVATDADAAGEEDAAGDAPVVGFAMAHRTAPAPIYAPASEVFLDELYVAPDARRRGLGTQLVAAVRAWADDLAADRLRLRVLTANAAGQAFWEAQRATPFSTTRTLELEGAAEDEQDTKPRRRLGF